MSKQQKITTLFNESELMTNIRCDTIKCVITNSSLKSINKIIACDNHFQVFCISCLTE